METFYGLKVTVKHQVYFVSFGYINKDIIGPVSIIYSSFYLVYSLLSHVLARLIKSTLYIRIKIEWRHKYKIYNLAIALVQLI